MRRIIHATLIVVTVVVTAVFAMLNSAATGIDLLVIEYTVPLSIVVVVCLFLGVGIGLLAAGIMAMQRRSEVRTMKRRLALAEEELQKLRKMPIKDDW